MPSPVLKNAILEFLSKASDRYFTLTEIAEATEHN